MTQAVVTSGVNWRETSLVRKVHGLNARILAIFIAAHLFNHLHFALGVEEHIAMMDKLRAIYRLPWLEYSLYGLFFVQIAAGLWLAKKNWKPGNKWSWAQVISGLLIAFFLVQHLAATIYVRSNIGYIDTDAHWALIVVRDIPFNLYFAPYYFIAVSAPFVHIACALHFAGGRASTLYARPVAIGGACLSAFIVGSMLVQASQIEFPADYQRYLTETLGA